MKVSCYQDKKSGRFFLIRNKRVVEVSEVSWMDVPSQAKGERVYSYVEMWADSGAFLYKEILLVADVFSKSFPDRKSAEEFLGKLKNHPEGESFFWIRHCLLDLEDGGSK